MWQIGAFWLARAWQPWPYGGKWYTYLLSPREWCLRWKWLLHLTAHYSVGLGLKQNKNVLGQWMGKEGASAEPGVRLWDSLKCHCCVRLCRFIMSWIKCARSFSSTKHTIKYKGCTKQTILYSKDSCIHGSFHKRGYNKRSKWIKYPV